MYAEYCLSKYLLDPYSQRSCSFIVTSQTPSSVYAVSARASKWLTFFSSPQLFACLLASYYIFQTESSNYVFYRSSILRVSEIKGISSTKLMKLDTSGAFETPFWANAYFLAWNFHRWAQKQTQTYYLNINCLMMRISLC